MVDEAFSREDAQDAQDRLWVRQVQQHDDRAAFACLLRRHQGMVRALLRRLTRGDAARADELAQEAFLQAYRALPAFRGEARFRSWLYRIACNCFLQQQRLGASELAQRSESLAEDDGAWEPAAGAQAELPQQVALRLDLGRALARLSAPEQEAIVHCYLAELSHSEAAALLGWPLGTLKTHLLRGKIKLKEFLQAWAPHATEEVLP
ncbi:RNA polymerase sigma factor [Roseateles sp.]|uniref:RNA polymerase sigma factor n=1 Tax=Roseateles sp. TaxID=1971397 RepID=UPI003D0FB1F5